MLNINFLLPTAFVTFLTHKNSAPITLPLLTVAAMTLSGCQTMSTHALNHKNPAPTLAVPAPPATVIATSPAASAAAIAAILGNTNPNLTSPPRPAIISYPAAVIQNFTITGKIGITTPKQSGSAFYSWAQANRNFAIDLSGAFGVGHTTVNYNGMTATLTSDKTGTLTADNPETLLQKAIGWQAPISQLPYWIMGQNAPSDTPAATAKDSQNRLSTAQNAGWTANFSYPNGNSPLPNKIIMQQQNGVKVTLTINHL